MIAASALSETEKSTDIARATGVALGRIGQARTVIQHAPELVESVISGAQSLDDAYGEARQRERVRSPNKLCGERVPGLGRERKG